MKMNNPDLATKSENRRSEKNISVDLTPEQKGKLKKLADRSGMKLSEYLRAVVASAIQERAGFQVEYKKLNQEEREGVHLTTASHA